MAAPSASSRRRFWPALATSSALVAGLATACGDDGDPERLTVLAAASLAEPFTALADELSGETDFSFGGSSTLVEQLAAGARADVLATADTRTMDRAVSAGLVDQPVVFASNTLVLAVPAGNPGGVSSLADLARDDLRVALCEPRVPCGAAAERLLDLAEVTARPDTLEADAQATAGKLALGEVDAALIYRTDVADDLDVVDIPEAGAVANEYFIAVVADSANPQRAAEFVAAVTGPVGRQILIDAGFGMP